jgi:hypothetical protein
MRLHDPATGEIPVRIRTKELQFAAALPTKESLVLSPLQKGGNAGQIQLSTWTPRGPYNVGGRTRALAVDLDNANVILAGGASGGMWRSTDAGTTWTKTTSPSQLQSATCIVQDPRPGKHSIWYYGTGEYDGTGTVPGAPIVVNPANLANDEVYAAVAHGIKRSRPAPLLWQQQREGVQT